MTIRNTRKSKISSARARKTLRTGTGVDARKLVAYINPKNDDLFRAYVVAKLSWIDRRLDYIYRSLDRLPEGVGTAMMKPISGITTKITEGNAATVNAMESLNRTLTESNQYKADTPETNDKSISYR
ncbi:MAG TPA: hypothetical protein VGB78_01110 [Thermoplasmata archaeon]|jgi:hypothetical protein